MFTVPPMICPLTPLALLLPKSTRHGVYTNRLMLFQVVRLLVETFGVVVLQVRPDCHERIRKTVQGPPPVPLISVLFVVWKNVLRPFASHAVQKMARFPLMLIEFLLHWSNGHPTAPFSTTT